MSDDVRKNRRRIRKYTSDYKFEPTEEFKEQCKRLRKLKFENHMSKWKEREDGTIEGSDGTVYEMSYDDYTRATEPYRCKPRKKKPMVEVDLSEEVSRMVKEEMGDYKSYFSEDRRRRSLYPNYFPLSTDGTNKETKHSSYKERETTIEETANRKYSRIRLSQDLSTLVNMLIELTNKFYWFISESEKRKGEYREPQYYKVWQDIVSIHKGFLDNANLIWSVYYMDRNGMDIAELLDLLTECRTAYSVCKSKLENLRLATRIPVDVYLDENININKE